MIQPRRMASYYTNVHPDATEKDAIDFANERYCGSPIEIAQFVRAWLDYRYGSTPLILNGNRFLYTADGSHPA
jgi:hypothetical protein